MDLIGNMPLNLVRRYVELKNVTLVFSNVPGGSQIHILDDCVVETIIPFIPLVHGIGELRFDWFYCFKCVFLTGISFALITYDDRIQIGMAVDKELLSKDKAQQIVDDIFVNIKLLYDEC